MKSFYKIVSTVLVLMSFVGHVLGSEMDILAALGAVTYAVLSLREGT